MMKVIDLIKKENSFLLACHLNPDGDALGSMISLGIILRRLGKEVHFYNRDPVPANLLFLPHSRQVGQSLPEKVDVGILIDCAQKKRASKDLAKYDGARMWAAIDHHYLENPDSDVIATIVDPNAAATGLLIYDLINDLGQKIDRDIATCLYCALAVDTGFFRYPNTGAKEFRLAEKLVQAGAEPWIISRGIEENYPASRLRLMGLAFSSLQMHLGGKFATIFVTQKMLKDSGATMEVSDEFAVYPRTIAGVEVSALFRELDGRDVKVSLRSKDTVDVAEIASKFGGGGHKRAAGCLIKGGSIDGAMEQILAAVKAVI